MKNFIVLALALLLASFIDVTVSYEPGSETQIYQEDPGGFYHDAVLKADQEAQKEAPRFVNHVNKEAWADVVKLQGGTAQGINLSKLRYYAFIGDRQKENMVNLPRNNLQVKIKLPMKIETG